MKFGGELRPLPESVTVNPTELKPPKNPKKGDIFLAIKLPWQNKNKPEGKGGKGLDESEAKEFHDWLHNTPEGRKFVIAALYLEREQAIKGGDLKAIARINDEITRLNHPGEFEDR